MSKELMPQSHCTVSYLGPGGTHSHLTALEVFSGIPDIKFRYAPAKKISDVFEFVSKGISEWGLVPYTNSESGVVEETAAQLNKAFFQDFEVFCSVSTKISQDLLSCYDMQNIDVIYSKKEAYQQCAKNISRLVGDHKFMECNSTGEAVQLAKKEPNSAAIASSKILQFVKKMNLLSNSIQDEDSNTTEFLIITKKGSDWPRSIVGLEQSTWLDIHTGLVDACLQELLLKASKWGLISSIVMANLHRLSFHYRIRINSGIHSNPCRFFLHEAAYLKYTILSSPYSIHLENKEALRQVQESIAKTSSIKENGYEELENLAKYLDEHVVNRLNRFKKEAIKLYVHPPVSSMECVWAVLGVSAKNMINTQILRDKTTNKIVFGCVAGDCRVSERKISRLLGGKFRRIPIEEFEHEDIKQVRGAVSPFTAGPGTVIIIDNSLCKNEDFIFLGSGNRNISIALNLRIAGFPDSFGIRYEDIKSDTVNTDVASLRLGKSMQMAGIK